MQYLAALEAEEARKNSIKQRAEEKDRLLAELYARRQKENDLKKVQTEFELKLRLDKVDSLQKASLYRRSQNLEKIMTEYEKTRTIMAERSDLQKRRKMANMKAAMERQNMSQHMEKLMRSTTMSTTNSTARPSTAAF